MAFRPLLCIRIDDDTVLRIYEERHAQEVAALVDQNRTYLRKWLPWVDDSRTVEDSKAFIRSSLQQFAQNEGFQMGIWYRDTFAGGIGYHQIDWVDRKVEIGYWLGEVFQGKGLMTKACRTLIAYAFTELGLNRVEIHCATENIRSCAIPKRLCWRMQEIVEWYNTREKSAKRAWLRRRAMSMYPRELGTIPEETARVARAACPKGTLAMRLRDALGELYQDEQFVALYPVEGQPAYAPWRLAVVTVLQYAENLTDRQAANAVRERIDWKYSLGLELTDPGFDFSLLSEFRMRLVDRRRRPCCSIGSWRCASNGAGSKPVASNAPIRRMCWHECARFPIWNVSEKRCEQLWMIWRSLLLIGWCGRSARTGLSATATGWRTIACPKRKASARHWHNRLGQMACICCRRWSRPKPLQNSRTLKVSNCCGRSGSSITISRAGRSNGEQARTAREGIIRSPYDPEARTGKKREMTWLGYKVHLTETCAMETS